MPIAPLIIPLFLQHLWIRHHVKIRYCAVFYPGLVTALWHRRMGIRWPELAVDVLAFEFCTLTSPLFYDVAFCTIILLKRSNFFNLTVFHYSRRKLLKKLSIIEALLWWNHQPKETISVQGWRALWPRQVFRRIVQLSYLGNLILVLGGDQLPFTLLENGFMVNQSLRKRKYVPWRNGFRFRPTGCATEMPQKTIKIYWASQLRLSLAMCGWLLNFNR